MDKVEERFQVRKRKQREEEEEEEEKKRKRKHFFEEPETESDDDMLLDPELLELKYDKNDNFFKRVREFAYAPRKTNIDFFPDVPNYYISQKNKTKWADEELTNLKIFRLEKLSISKLVTLGRKTFKSIHEGASKQSIANLMVLAYNLMDETGNELIADYEINLVNFLEMVYPIELDNKPIIKKEYKKMIMEKDNLSKLKLAIGYTYLAASYLRLFSKSDENYIRCNHHLKNKFSDFYHFSFPFEDFHPDIKIIRSIKNQFEIDSRFKNTLYVFLYASCENQKGENLKEFLYKIHLKYTGMHSFVLFTKCMDALNVDDKCLSKQIHDKCLSQGLRIPLFERQLKGIGDLLEMDRSELKMWKFGRIFDPTFMSVLQTKNCFMFCLVLAYILKEARKDKEDPLKIAQIKDASALNHRQAYAMAHKVVTRLMQ